jgi:hypothetical protein
MAGGVFGKRGLGVDAAAGLQGRAEGGDIDQPLDQMWHALGYAGDGLPTKAVADKRDA